MGLLSKFDNEKDGLMLELYNNMGGVKTKIDGFMATVEDGINLVYLENEKLVGELKALELKVEEKKGIIDRLNVAKDGLEGDNTDLKSKNDVLVLRNDELVGENVVLKADNKKLVGQIDDKDLIIKQLKGN